MVSEVIIMKDDKKNPKNPQEETQTKMRKMARKRWFYPAVYLCVAALVMCGVLWMENGIGNQGANPNSHSKSDEIANQKTNNNPDAVAVTNTNEVLKWPVSDPSAVTIGQKFYDPSASADEQVAALVNYDNTYAPNTGINIVAKDKKSFDVTAAMSGKVVRAQQDPLLGFVVELEHSNGVTTLYESLAKVNVQKGDQVKQGQLLGTAGTEKFNPNMGTHLHFEVRKENIPVNPMAFWNKETASVTAKVTSTDSSSSASKQNANTDQNNTTKETNNQNNMNSDPSASNSPQDSTSQTTPDSTDSTSGSTSN
jgi:stage II sporulation protein Q